LFPGDQIDAAEALRFFELALVLVRLDHVASHIVNAGFILQLPCGAPAPGGNSRPLKPDGAGIPPIYYFGFGLRIEPIDGCDLSTSPFFEIARVLVRLAHVASVIANGGSAPFVLVIFGVPIRKDNERYAQCQRTKSNQ
jgi:hypothetical protein